jgi:hypothetical protein
MSPKGYRLPVSTKEKKMATKEKTPKAKVTTSNGWVAICDGTHDAIFGYGKTKKQAKTNMWNFVHKYLVEREAPETQGYTHKQLEEYFGYSSFELSAPSGYTNS